jgi:hypothetical protein
MAGPRAVAQADHNREVSAPVIPARAFVPPSSRHSGTVQGVERAQQHETAVVRPVDRRRLRGSESRCVVGDRYRRGGGVLMVWEVTAVGEEEQS